MITLHHCHQTRSMRVLWLLNELDVDFEVVVHPFDKSLRQPDYLSLSPVGRVPALELDGDVIFESLAIMQVLATRYSPDRLGRLPKDPDWVEWLTWLNFAESLSQHTAALTQQHIAIYEDSMRSPVVMRLEAARAGKCLDALEARLSTPSEGREYLLTSGFTAADIAVGQAVYMARHFILLSNWPKVEEWYGRITDRDGFRASLPGPDDELLYARDFYPAWEVEG